MTPRKGQVEQRPDDAEGFARLLELLNPAPPEPVHLGAPLTERVVTPPPVDAELDAESDPAEWQDWTDDYRFEPSPADEALAAIELNRAATDYDVLVKARDRRTVQTVLTRSMINPRLAALLAAGTIPLD